MQVCLHSRYDDMSVAEVVNYVGHIHGVKVLLPKDSRLKHLTMQEFKVRLYENSKTDKCIITGYASIDDVAVGQELVSLAESNEKVLDDWYKRLVEVPKKTDAELRAMYPGRQLGLLKWECRADPRPLTGSLPGTQPW